MRASCRILSLLLLLCAPPTLAREVAGVPVAESTAVAGKSLTLNGVGVRKKFLFKIYVAALYVEAPSRDASAVLSFDGARRIEVHLLRDLSREQITDAIRDGFKKNAGERLPAMQARLDQLLGRLSDLKKGSAFSVDYLPGRGTQLVQGEEELVLPGKDFADALFSVWLAPAAK